MTQFEAVTRYGQDLRNEQISGEDLCERHQTQASEEPRVAILIRIAVGSSALLVCVWIVHPTAMSEAATEVTNVRCMVSPYSCA